MKTNTLLLALFLLTLITIGCKPAQQAQGTVEIIGAPDKDGYVELTPGLIQSLKWDADSIKKAPLFLQGIIEFGAQFVKINDKLDVTIVYDTTVIISPENGEKYRKMRAVTVSSDGRDISVIPVNDKTRREIKFSISTDGQYHCLIENQSQPGENFICQYGNQKYQVSKKVYEYILYTRVKYLGNRRL